MSLLGGGGPTYTYQEIKDLIQAVRNDFDQIEQDNRLETATPIAALCILAGLKAGDIGGGGS